MLSGLRYWWKLRRLQRRERKANRDLDAKLKIAQAKDDYDERSMIFADWAMSEEIFKSDIGLLQTQRLRVLAQHYRVPVPPFDTKTGDWVESEYSGKVFLSLRAIHVLRAEIRRVRKEAREMWIPLVSVGGAVVSILGAAYSVWHAASGGH
jgi:hypothetical protein